MSEQLILETVENDKASQLYKRHTELAAMRDPYADHLDALADAHTRLDEIKDGGLKSRITNRKEATELKRVLFNNQAAVDSTEGDPRDAYEKMANRIQKEYDANIEEAKVAFSPENQDAFYKDAVEMDEQFVKKEAVTALASQFHEQWRAGRLKDDGTFEPREKPTKDAAWIEAHGTDMVDIANTDFANLPADWQAENAAAAEVVVDLLEKVDGEVDLSDSEVRDQVGNVVHEAWLARNEWAKGTELDVPFSDLSAEEQAKDINQVGTALELFHS